MTSTNIYFCEKVAYIWRNISKECKLIFRFVLLTCFTLTTYLKTSTGHHAPLTHIWGEKCEIFCCCHLNKSLHNYKQPVCLQAKNLWCYILRFEYYFLTEHLQQYCIQSLNAILIKMTACMFQLKPLKVNQTIKMSSHTGAKKKHTKNYHHNNVL